MSDSMCCRRNTGFRSALICYRTSDGRYWVPLEDGCFPFWYSVGLKSAKWWGTFRARKMSLFENLYQGRLRTSGQEKVTEVIPACKQSPLH